MVEFARIDGSKECECHYCIRTYDKTDGKLGFPLDATKMILCPNCGNKRCPHTSYHGNRCTNSNEPGQEGSIY